MKSKWIFCLAVLLLSAPVVTNTQEIQFDGYFNSGLGVVYSTHADTDTYLKAFGVDSEQNGYRFRLNGSYTNEEENIGVKFRFQSQSSLDPGGYFSLPYVYGWLNFFDDTIYVAAGIVDDSTWQTADWWINDDTGEGLGLLLKATPLEGLDLGFGAYIISQQGSGSNNILSYGSLLPNFGTITPKIQDAKYVFSASYTMPDLFYLGASFRLKNKAGWHDSLEDIKKFGYNYENRHESSQLISEFRFLRVENLTAIVAASFDNIQEFDINGNIIITQTLGYELNNLSLGLNAAEFLYIRKDFYGNKIPYKPSLLFNLWGTYTIDNITPRLDLAYFFNGQSTAWVDETYMWHRRGFVNPKIDSSYSVDNYCSVFSVRPSVRLNLTRNIFLEVGDMFNYEFSNFDGAYGDSSDPGKRSLISNVFYLDFTWAFPSNR